MYQNGDLYLRKRAKESGGRVCWLIKGKNYGGKMESQKILGVKKKEKERPYIIRKLREDEQNDPIKRNKTRIIIHLRG